MLWWGIKPLTSLDCSCVESSMSQDDLWHRGFNKKCAAWLDQINKMTSEIYFDSNLNDLKV